MFTYHLYLSRKKTNSKTGLAPIYAKIYINGSSKERSSNLWVEPMSWSNEYKSIKPNAPNAEITNKLITEFKNKLNGLQKITNSLTAIDYELNKKANNSLNIVPVPKVIDHYIDYKQTLVGKPDGIVACTIKSYNTRKKNIVSFLNSIDQPAMCISEFNIAFGEKLKNHLYSKGFKASHVQKHLVFMQTLVEYSKNEFSTKETNLLNVTFKKPQPNNIISLTEEEISKIINKIFESSLMQKTADLFLLQCFTGMSYCDVIGLSTEMIEKFKGRYFLSYNRNKTNNNALLPLHPLVVEILNRYNGKAPKISNQQYNLTLKVLAADVGINKHLTTHMGRKTFATLLINDGVSVEAVTKMLGKTNVQETTKVYANIGHQLMISQQPAYLAFRQPTLF
jgi:integrase/recombinase XerD